MKIPILSQSISTLFCWACYSQTQYFFCQLLPQYSIFLSSDCSLVYAFCTSNCHRNSFTYKFFKSISSYILVQLIHLFKNTLYYSSAIIFLILIPYLCVFRRSNDCSSNSGGSLHHHHGLISSKAFADSDDGMNAYGQSSPRSSGE